MLLPPALQQVADQQSSCRQTSSQDDRQVRVGGSSGSQQAEHGAAGEDVIGFHVRERSNRTTLLPCNGGVTAMPLVMESAPDWWDAVLKRAEALQLAGNASHLKAITAT